MTRKDDCVIRILEDGQAILNKMSNNTFNSPCFLSSSNQYAQHVYHYIK